MYLYFLCKYLVAYCRAMARVLQLSVGETAQYSTHKQQKLLTTGGSKMKQQRWFVFLMILATLISTAGNTEAGSKKSLAVMEFEGLGVSKVECHVISERFRAELSRTDQFLVVDRRQMAHVLQSEESNNGYALDFVALGEKMGVERFSVGNISKIGTTFSVVANLIDAETGQTIKTVIEDFSGSIDSLLQKGVRQVAENLAQFEGTGYLVFVGPRRDDSIRRLTVKINGEKLREFPDGDFMMISKVPAGTHTLEFEWSRPGINGRRPLPTHIACITTSQADVVRRVAKDLLARSLSPKALCAWPTRFDDGNRIGRCKITGDQWPSYYISLDRFWRLLLF